MSALTAPSGSSSIQGQEILLPNCYILCVDNTAHTYETGCCSHACHRTLLQLYLLRRCAMQREQQGTRFYALFRERNEEQMAGSVCKPCLCGGTPTKPLTVGCNQHERHDDIQSSKVGGVEAHEVSSLSHTPPPSPQV
jgi:hypothetical protein